MAFIVELIGPAVSNFSWDPTVQLSLLFDTDVPPSSTPSANAEATQNTGISIGLVVGVSIAVVVVVGIVSLTNCGCLFSEPDGDEP
jgi:hypothetical protein